MDAIKERFNRLAGAGWTPGTVALLLLGLLFAAFPQILLGTHSFFYRDYGVLAYPFIEYQRDCFWRGELPLWNPYSNCGAPFLAQWGTMTLYPGSLIYLLLPLPWSLSLFCFLHLALGGAGVFALARRWVGDGLPPMVAGTAYVFSGTMFACLLWPNYTVALGWLPWVVLLVEGSWGRGGRALVSAALAGAMQMLAGVPEVVMLTWILLGTLWLSELACPESAGRRPAMIGRLAVVVLLVAGVCAVQLLPFLELLGQSQRDAGFATGKWPMPSWGLANFLVPLFHTSATFQGPHLQPGQAFLSSYYPGAVIVLLAILAVFWVRARRVRILAGLTVAAVLLAWGEQGLLYPLARSVLPPLGLARYPVKFLLLAAFALPLLAAWAVRELTASPGHAALRRPQLLRAGALAILVIGLLAGWAALRPYQSPQWSAEDNADQAAAEARFVPLNAAGRALGVAALLGLLCWLPRARDPRQRGLAQAALLGCLCVDVVTHAPPQNPSLPSAIYSAGLWAQNNTVPAPGLAEGRVLISPGAEQRLLRSSTTNNTHDFLGKRLALWSNLNLLERVPKVNGSSTLQLREQAQVQNLIYKATNSPSWSLLRLLGVTLFSPAENPTAWVPLSNAVPIVSAGQRPVFLDEAGRLQGLASPSFNPQTEVFLQPGDTAHAAGLQHTDARILKAELAAGRVTAVVETPEPTVVVIAQSWARGWRATVNGQPAPVLRANHAFQAVPIPAGRHEVQVAYRDQTLPWGAALTLLTLLGCAALWFAQRHPQDVPKAEEPRAGQKLHALAA
ncbi:MAG: hypothetical protein RJA22_3232 [Verrucomicrobiota bacterium]